MAPSNKKAKGEVKKEGRLYQILLSPKVQTLIIAVPGVGTPPPDEWLSEQTSAGERRLWFESIPGGVAPGIGVYGYHHGIDASGLSWHDLLEHGGRFVTALQQIIEELNLGHCPVLIVCHSLGGLIVKEALRLAYEQNYRNLLRALAGVILLGTPHSGTESRDKWQNATVMLSKKSKRLSSDDLTRLSKSSLLFEQAAVTVPILSVYETKETKVKSRLWITKKTLIMDEAFVKTNSSYEEMLGIAADHNTLCHVDTSAKHFGKISTFISTSLEDARLKIVKGSPIFDAPSSFGDFSDFTPETAASKSQGETGGSPNRRSTESRSPISRNTRRATAATSDMGFEIVPRLSAHPSFPVRRISGSRFPLHLVPVVRNREFFGRQNELAAIEKFFFDEDENRDSPGNALVRTFAICGPGGMGKTQVAGEFVHTRKDRFDMIFWVHADSSAKLHDEFSRLAVKLGLVARDSTDARDQIITRDLVKGWLADPVKDRGATAAFWLLVFDNVDDMDVLEGFWPLDGPGCVLFTSRDPLAMKSTYLADTGIDLQPFSARESSSFLEKLTLKKGDSSAVHARLGGLPLAMTQMASVIIRRDLSYSEFAQSYDELTKREELFQSQYSKPGRKGHEKSIWTVWALESLKHGRSLLEVLSMLDPDGILEDLLTNEAAKPVQLKTFPKTPTEYQKARTELLQSSLISKDNSSKRIVIHRLIQDTARAKMTTAQFNETFDACLHLVSSMWPYEKFGWRHGVARWARCEELFPHVVTLRRLADQIQTLDGHGGDLKNRLRLPKLLIDAGWYYHETGHSTESEPYFDFSIKICRSILAQLKNSTPTQSGVTNGFIEADLKSMMAEVHHNLGCIGTETNRPEFTLHHFQLYNDMMIRESGSHTRGRDSRLHISWNELGNAFMMNRRWADGERCFTTSIESAKLQPDYKPTDASFPHVNLGLAYWLMGRHDAAMAQLKAGLCHREQAFGVNDSQSFITGRFLHAIGNVKASLGLYGESFVFHSRALAQYQKTIGKNHHRTGDVHVKMAEHFIRDKKFPAASEHICEALRIFGDRPAYRHEKMRALFKAAAMYSGQGKETEAVQARDRCAALYGELYPGSGKAAADLTDADVDDAVAFWSR
ncbi:hypothetical protein RB598_003018 [Gaeumannomyces tritici]